MRGAVSLAVALAIPLTTDAGDAFPQRDLIIFLTFAVILLTLVLQGLSLPYLIRALDVDDGGAGADEESGPDSWRPRRRFSSSTLLEREEWTRDDTVERMRGCTPIASGGSPPAPARSRTRATRNARSPTSRWCRWSSPHNATP